MSTDNNTQTKEARLLAALDKQFQIPLYEKLKADIKRNFADEDNWDDDSATVARLVPSPPKPFFDHLVVEKTVDRRPTGATDKATEIVRGFSRPFGLTELYSAMQEKHPETVSSKHSFRSVLERLLDRNVIELHRKGKGRRENQYRVKMSGESTAGRV